MAFPKSALALACALMLATAAGAWETMRGADPWGWARRGGWLAHCMLDAQCSPSLPWRHYWRRSRPIPPALLRTHSPGRAHHPASAEGGGAPPGSQPVRRRSSPLAGRRRARGGAVFTGVPFLTRICLPLAPPCLPAVAQTLPTVADVKDTVMGAADTAMGAVEGAAGAVSGAVSGAVDDVTSAVEDVKGGKEHTWDTLLDLISTKNNTSIIEQAVEVAAESGLINDLAAALNDTTTGAPRWLARNIFRTYARICLPDSTGPALPGTFCAHLCSARPAHPRSPPPDSPPAPRPAVATVFLPRDEELGADMAAVESLLADPVRLCVESPVKEGTAWAGVHGPPVPRLRSAPPSCPPPCGG